MRHNAKYMRHKQSGRGRQDPGNNLQGRAYVQYCGVGEADIRNKMSRDMGARGNWGDDVA